MRKKRENKEKIIITKFSRVEGEEGEMSLSNAHKFKVKPKTNKWRSRREFVRNGFLLAAGVPTHSPDWTPVTPTSIEP